MQEAIISNRERALIYRVRRDLEAPQALDARQKRIRELFLAAESLEIEEAPNMIEQITDEIENELQFEEDFLFPVIRLRGSRHAQKVVDEALGNHEIIRMFVARLKRKEEDLRNLLSRLRQETAQHFRERYNILAVVKACLR